MGCRIIPVLVYYPEVTTVLGEQVVRDLKAINGPVDILVRGGLYVPRPLAWRLLRPHFGQQ